MGFTRITDDRLFFKAILKDRILPAITFNSLAEVIPVTEAILQGGGRCMEVAFRTEVGAASIKLITENFPEMTVGAGTLLTIDQVDEAIGAGAGFGLSPGFNPAVCEYCKRKNFSMIPGIMTPSEIEQAVTLGFNLLKVFPISHLGGVNFLKSINGPYQHLKIQFIPMGGITLFDMDEYLKIENVLALGGSWLASRILIERKDYLVITKNVKEALLKTH